jgi:hypothetical protein
VSGAEEDGLILFEPLALALREEAGGVVFWVAKGAKVLFTEVTFARVGEVPVSSSPEFVGLFFSFFSPAPMLPALGSPWVWLTSCSGATLPSFVTPTSMSGTGFAPDDGTTPPDG